jgi:hypothetical protein
VVTGGGTFFTTISQGRAAYETAVRAPDRLAVLFDPGRDDCQFEGLWGIALVVSEERTGEPPPTTGGGWGEPCGHRRDFDDEEHVTMRLPKLAALYRA